MDIYERAGNELAAVLCECCTVEEVENTLAQINPEDWKRAAEKALDAAGYRGAVEERDALRTALEHIAADDDTATVRFLRRYAQATLRRLGGQ